MSSSTQNTPALGADVEQQMRAIMAQWAEPIYRHIRRLVVSHADAQDATQETFIKVFRHIQKLRQTESLKAWLYRIATNEALRLIANRKLTNLLDGDISEANTLPADGYIDYTDLEAVKLQRAIHTLPPKQQAVFLLRYYDDLSFAEIAEVTDCSADTAKVNYHYAKTKITEYFNAHDT